MTDLWVAPASPVRVAGRAPRDADPCAVPLPRLRRLLVPALALAAGVSAAPPATAATAPRPAVSSSPSVAVREAYDARIVALVNAARRSAGLRPLAVSSCVDRFADQWSARMATTGSFAHRTDLRRVMTTCAAQGVAENIAYGNVTADQMMKMWMASPGHRANVLGRSYTHLGVGTARTSSGRVYGTQNFLRMG